jgi:hypothetical protein
MIKAVKEGRTGIFSDIDWKSGQPQRYGWREEGQEGKTLPKAIVDFIERKAIKQKEVEEPITPPVIEVIKPNPVKVVKAEKVVTTAGGTNKKPKTKKNDNPKQKVRRAGKHNAGSVAKA